MFAWVIKMSFKSKKCEGVFCAGLWGSYVFIALSMVSMQLFPSLTPIGILGIAVCGASMYGAYIVDRRISNEQDSKAGKKDVQKMENPLEKAKELDKGNDIDISVVDQTIKSTPKENKKR